MLGWGIGLALVSSVVIRISTGEGFIVSLPYALIVGAVVGALIGYYDYRIAFGTPIKHARNADDVRDSIPSVEIMHDFQVGMLPLKILGWFGIVLFTVFFVGSVMIGNYAFAFFSFLLIGLDVFLLLATGTYTLNETKIRYLCPIGNFEMRWDEIEFVEVDAERQAYVLSSNTKRLPILSPVLWSGPDKQAAGEFFFAQIERHAYPERVSRLALIRLPKNVRVRR